MIVLSDGSLTMVLQLELAASLAEAANLDVFTQLQVPILDSVQVMIICISPVVQALNYIGNKIKPSKGFVYSPCWLASRILCVYVFS